MINKKSQFLNKMFLLFALGGFILIFNQEKLEDLASFLLPMGIVFIYGLIVKSSSRGLNDFDLAEHHTESIYFLGFLFTLISLAALDGFVEATRRFSADLKDADNSLVNHVDYYMRTAELQSKSIIALNDASRDLAESTLRIRNDIEMIPMEDVADNIRTLGEETGELNTVIDSLLEIMDHKLERVG